MFLKLLAGLLLIVTCSACHSFKTVYTNGQFFDDLVSQSGLVKDGRSSVDVLYAWGGLKKQSYDLDQSLNYQLFCETITNMLTVDVLDPIEHLKTYGWIDNHVTADDSVEKTIADQVIALLLEKINNPKITKSFDLKLDKEYTIIESSIKDYVNPNLEKGRIVYSSFDEIFYEYTILDDGNLGFKACDFENLVSKLKFSSTELLDLSKASVIPYGDVNQNIDPSDGFKLLSTSTNSFYQNGFKVSYTVSPTKIRFYISKKTNQGLNAYGEFSLSNIKPDFVWDYSNGTIKHAYFKLNFNTLENFGLSKGRYHDAAINFKDLDSSSFLKLLQSTMKTKNDALDTTIPLCKIKIPISGMPLLNLNLDLSLHLYMSGRIELKITDAYCLGFEVRNNQMRFIFDQDHDIDAIINASANSSLGANFHLDIIGQSLMDINIKAGIRAYLQTVLHMYDSEGQSSKTKVDMAYEQVAALAEENSDVAICGDLSFHWLLELVLNTPRTLLGRLGLSKTYSLLDDDNQIFNNMSHLENGHFVKSCTRKNRPKFETASPIYSDKILLEKYSAVVEKGANYLIPIKSLPEGYDGVDLLYQSVDETIATVQNGIVKGLKPGSTIINITTKDSAYKQSFNILVSDG